MENGNGTAALSMIDEMITKANLDPKLAAKLEIIALRLYAAGAFTVSHQELESLFQAYKQKYESEAGTETGDLTKAEKDITSLVVSLNERINIEPMVKDGGQPRHETLQLLGQIAKSMDQDELTELTKLMDQDMPNGDANLVRERSLETRDGVTEVLWELAHTLKEEAAHFRSAIPKTQQDGLFKEFAYDCSLSARVLGETISWLEMSRQPDAGPQPERLERQ
ncbi:hypothetical protein A3J32_02540 [Candidatus Saccharibacteria bacterium RIFCSPLOWO2_02_FULL_46_7]|nr:MAG: hypothetical protein A3J32_02540 [Candidatus Saccharibacteria bacterium RIFCSPLOWO2_02_FULL_46_7]